MNMAQSDYKCCKRVDGQAMCLKVYRGFMTVPCKATAESHFPCWLTRTAPFFKIALLALPDSSTTRPFFIESKLKCTAGGQYPKSNSKCYESSNLLKS